MIISFRSLSESDFPLLLKWLETPHVKAWWDKDVLWSIDKVEKKYLDYVFHYKIEKGEKKSIFAYIIELEGAAVGYIQYYDARDFLTIPEGRSIPENTASIDLYIGEQSALKKGVGSKALLQLMNDKVFNQFDAALVTPDIKNHGAIACYQRAGFISCLTKQESNERWLIAKKDGRHDH